MPQNRMGQSGRSESRASPISLHPPAAGMRYAAPGPGSVPGYPSIQSHGISPPQRTRLSPVGPKPPGRSGGWVPSGPSQPTGSLSPQRSTFFAVSELPLESSSRHSSNKNNSKTNSDSSSRNNCKQNTSIAPTIIH